MLLGSFLQISMIEMLWTEILSGLVGPSFYVTVKINKQEHLKEDIFFKKCVSYCHFFSVDDLRCRHDWYERKAEQSRWSSCCHDIFNALMDTGSESFVFLCVLCRFCRRNTAEKQSDSRGLRGVTRLHVALRQKLFGVYVYVCVGGGWSIHITAAKCKSHPCFYPFFTNFFWLLWLLALPAVS